MFAKLLIGVLAVATLTVGGLMYWDAFEPANSIPGSCNGSQISCSEDACVSEEPSCCLQSASRCTATPIVDSCSTSEGCSAGKACCSSKDEAALVEVGPMPRETVAVK